MKINVIENGKVTTRDMTEEEEAKYKAQRELSKYQKIDALREKLSNTDYVVLKIAEAVAYNDMEKVSALKYSYATELANRNAWREQINELEKN